MPRRVRAFAGVPATPLRTGDQYMKASILLLFSLLLAWVPRTRASAPVETGPTLPDARIVIGELLHRDDFDHGLDHWTAELERGGTVAIKDQQLDIDVPAGCTLWFKEQLSGPILIEYEATMIAAGGPHDRVSDLNCFWMARDARSPDNIFDTKRSGKFSDYDRLLTYYVGQGGNGNTTTRFRRYIGQQDNRPLLPEHDLRDRDDLLKPNVPQTIQLVVNGLIVQYYRDGKRVFDVQDPQPYTSGWFALRTTKNHMAVRRFRVYRLSPAPTTQPSDAAQR
jgi:hypothetical protein